MVLEFGQNMSIGCQLKGLKAELTEWSPRKFIGIKKKEGQNDLPKDGSVKKIQKISMVKCESWNAAIGHTKLNLSKIL